MKKVKKILFLILLTVFCLAGCGRDTAETGDGGELVKAGEAPRLFVCKRGIKLDRQRWN